MERFRRHTPLQAALQSGLAEDVDLAEALIQLSDYQVTSVADGEAICDALEKIVEGWWPRKPGLDSPLSALMEVVLEVEGDSDAAPVLLVRGIPLLLQILDQGLVQRRYPERDLFSVLEFISVCPVDEVIDLMIRAARKPLGPGVPLWLLILANLEEEPVQAWRLMDALSSPLPPQWIGVALLALANDLFIDGADGHHPFDSQQGVRRLKQYLCARESHGAAYAATALPFLSHPHRDRLLCLALAHEEIRVQVAAAWAAAKLERPEGIARLAQFCLDVNYSVRAKRYLEELKRADAIPEAALRPDFQARAELAVWLAHKPAFARGPDMVEVVKHRKLRWPPEFEVKSLYLIRYCFKDPAGLDEDKVGLGVVGSITRAFLGEDLGQQPPEDAYARHCCWELMVRGLWDVTTVEEDSTEYDGLLSQWTGPQLTAARMAYIGELSPQLNYPRRLVGIAGGCLQGVRGWLVLDGPDSHWYPAEQFPPGESGEELLDVHVGRCLLGLPIEVSRKPWLMEKSKRPPGQLIAAYERVLEEACTCSRSNKRSFRDKQGSLSEHFQAYVDALSKAGGETRAAALTKTFEKLLDLDAQAEDLLGAEAFERPSAVWHHFGAYVDALVELGLIQKIRSVISLLESKWSRLGFGKLGTAAFKAGELRLAEGFLTQLKEELGNEWHFRGEVALLAEIWCRRGQQAKARAALLDSLRAVQAESPEDVGIARTFLEDCFKRYRQAFIQLFPDGAADLAAEKIPETTLRRRRAE